MTTDLHDRLADLAGHLAPASAPPDLWDRGGRRRRGVAAGRVAGAVVLAALVGIGGLTWQQSRPVQPADTHGSPQVPDRFFVPSPWLGAFDGPPGALVAIGTAERQTLLHTRSGIFGVSASTGEYGFLDLPSYAVTRADLNETRAPILSPDGRRIATWATGTPSGSPNTHLVDGMTITGVAVYDATTGRTVRTSIPTEHGLSPSALQWVDDQTLAIGIDQASFGDANENSCCVGHWQGLAVWHVGDPSQPTQLSSDLPLFIEDNTTSAGDGRVVYSDSRRQVHVIDPLPPGVDRRLSLPRATERTVLSADNQRLAFVSQAPSRDATYASGVLYVGDVPPGTGSDRVRAAPVPGANHFERVVAWADRTHVVVLSKAVVDHQMTYGLDSVDVGSGEQRTLISPANGEGVLPPTAVSLAADLLSAPSSHASAPPRPWSHRTVAIDVLIGLVILGLLLWGTRVSRA
jgi:hypothetical protein